MPTNMLQLAVPRRGAPHGSRAGQQWHETAGTQQQTARPINKATTHKIAALLHAELAPVVKSSWVLQVVVV